jgi:hypothetical protein
LTLGTGFAIMSFENEQSRFFVIPAQAGIHYILLLWIPVFTGMTLFK